MAQTTWGTTITLRSTKEMGAQVKSIRSSEGSTEKLPDNLANSIVNYLSQYSGTQVESGFLLRTVIDATANFILDEKKRQKKEQDVELPSMIKDRKFMHFAKAVVHALANDAAEQDETK